MFMRKFLLVLVCFLPALAVAHHEDKGGPGLRDATVLIVRHAEKASAGDGLSPQGEQRAIAYASYFDPWRDDRETLMPQRLIATRDSKESARPRLTLTPLSQRIDLPIEQPFADDQVDELAKSLRRDNRANVVLIAWHHGHIDKLIDALGGNAGHVIGRKSWPEDVYNWVVVLHFDHHGELDGNRSRVVVEPF
ncbi:flagellar basal body-associated protein FliL [Dyella sp. ASV21]|uniref:flagellar basal body-associated protein FliL n=1 Tax=Dyella sp. ASV21 TaxID=2795114 RepID=UPI0018EE2DB8|nr:flagellar basal body-associated protein FliL [Dyella sp. ASV21]